MYAISINYSLSHYIYYPIIIPLLGFIRIVAYSSDVIHTLGFYSWGIKIDSIDYLSSLILLIYLLFLILKLMDNEWTIQ